MKKAIYDLPKPIADLTTQMVLVIWIPPGRAIVQGIGIAAVYAAPYDRVVEGKAGSLVEAQAKEMLQEWVDASATWWTEGLWEASEKQVAECIRQGSPRN